MQMFLEVEECGKKKSPDQVHQQIDEDKVEAIQLCNKSANPFTFLKV